MAQPLSGRRFGDHSWDIESSPGDVKRTLSAPMKKNEKNPGTLFGSVMLWYSSALVTITTSKMILYRLPFPYVVCYFQFGIAALCCGVYMHAYRIPSIDISLNLFEQDGGGHDQNSTGSSATKTTALGVVDMSSLVRNGGLDLTASSVQATDAVGVEHKRRSLLWQIATGYSAGFLLTNQAFSMSSVSFAETIKSGEPVCTVLLNILLFKRWPRRDALLALVVICIGVGTSCFGDANFVLPAFVCALMSNVCFGGRAVLSKKLFQLDMYTNATKGKTDAHTGLRLFAKVSELGMCMIAPFALYVEGGTLFKTVMGPGEDAASSATLSLCAGLIVVNGLSYATYNLMSFVVLSKTDVVTHAALNIFRRVVIIVATSILFGVTLTRLNVFGVGLAICGALAYAHAKSKIIKRLARAREGYEANLRNARSLNLRVGGELGLESSHAPVLMDPSFKEFQSSVEAMTSSLAHLRSPGSSPARDTVTDGATMMGSAGEYHGDDAAAMSLLPMPPGVATEDADERVSIIVSLQDEVEQLERQLSCERETRRRLQDQVNELQERSEEEEGYGGSSREQLLKENADLKEKLLRATRVLARLRFRRKEQELLE